ncbi:MAG: cytochrome c biogenesis CcdA family protein, partial [Acidimicrobiales bacterium]
MISGTVALAFTAGMVATFNPCGFSLLPAYIGAFVAGDEVTAGVDRRVLRAVAVAAAVSIGFIIVFATVGLVIDRIAGEARRQLPWVTIVIGGLLIVGGVATVAGWSPNLALRGPRLSTGSSSAPVMVGYGITYAIASLSCTIGPFLAVTGTALSRSPMEAIAAYVAYALGMGIIILVLSIASALAHGTVTNHMRRLSRIAV